jgi:hypothetical protein
MWIRNTGFCDMFILLCGPHIYLYSGMSVNTREKSVISWENRENFTHSENIAPQARRKVNKLIVLI